MYIVNNSLSLSLSKELVVADDRTRTPSPDPFESSGAEVCLYNEPLLSHSLSLSLSLPACYITN